MLIDLMAPDTKDLPAMAAGRADSPVIEPISMRRLLAVHRRFRGLQGRKSAL